MYINYKNIDMNISYIQEESKFSATSSKFPNFQCFGNTIEEACKNLKLLIDVSLKGLENSRAIPPNCSIGSSGVR